MSAREKPEADRRNTPAQQDRKSIAGSAIPRGEGITKTASSSLSIENARTYAEKTRTRIMIET